MENNESKQIFKQIVNNAKLLIDRNIYKFLFSLFYFIILKTNNRMLKETLNGIINHINSRYIQKQNEKLNDRYQNKNLINILKFVKSQNSLYAGEIIENILIIIFSLAFKTEKENSFGKFLYNNIEKLKKTKNDVIAKWFIKGRLNDKVSKIKELLKSDTLERDEFIDDIKEEPLYDLLKEIYQEDIIRKKISKRKIMNYINKRIFDFNNKIMIQKENLKKNKNKNDEENIDFFTSITDYDSMKSNFFFGDTTIYGEKIPIPMGKKKKVNPVLPLIRSLLISVYVYYQNKNSTLMKYRSNEILQKIPIEFDISEAAIELKFAKTVLSPLRIEPRIERLKLSRNLLKKEGFKEMAKILLFNQNIQKIDFHTCVLKSSFIDFFNNAIGLFDNSSVEVLNLSYNLLKEDCSEYLANILTHLKNLKIINLSSNDLKRGISSFLITLKELYRKGNSNLVSLNLNKCILDDISYYELGELLKTNIAN